MIQEEQTRFFSLSSLAMGSRGLGILSACTLFWNFQRGDRHSCGAVGAAGERKHPGSCSAVGTQIPSRASLFLPVQPIHLVDWCELALPAQELEACTDSDLAQWHHMPRALVSSTQWTPVCQQRAGRGTQCCHWAGFYSCAHRENYKSTGQSQPILGETAGFSTGTHALSFTSLKAYQPEGSNPIHYFILACNVIHHFSPLDVNTSLSGKTVAVSAMWMSTLPWVVEGSYTVAEFKITIQRSFFRSFRCRKSKASPDRSRNIYCTTLATSQAARTLHIPRFCKVSQEANLNQKDGYQALL